ncbi:hypothetical protein, partial [Hydrocarboniphaga sp.]|uniref:hypothetical protein n=1 Tax=Hydrocarboniphaga sp. TaxID=2033016 RepID=UPI0026195B5F
RATRHGRLFGGNPKGWPQSGRIAASLPPCVRPVHRVGRSLHCARFGASAAINSMSTGPGVHDSEPQSFVARLLSIPMGVLFKGVAKKALLQDLNDIKSAVEQGS